MCGDGAQRGQCIAREQIPYRFVAIHWVGQWLVRKAVWLQKATVPAAPAGWFGGGMRIYLYFVMFSTKVPKGHWGIS